MTSLNQNKDTNYLPGDRGAAVLLLNNAGHWRKMISQGWTRKECIRQHKAALKSARRYRAIDTVSPFTGWIAYALECTE